MPFQIRKPTTESIESKLAALESPLSYPDVGKTRQPDEAPPAYRNHDHYEVHLGDGDATFRRAKDALRAWRHFPEWVQVVYPYPAFEEGRPVAIVVPVLGVYTINFTRIVYHIDEERRFGFAYGTTTRHEENGEARFLVDWREDGVWYSHLSFSGPQSLLARLGYPYARRQQKRFGRDSLDAMRKVVGGDDHA